MKAESNTSWLVDSDNDKNTANVDWEKYAAQFDTLCSINPEYQKNVKLLTEHIDDFSLPSAPCICDLGAGTGNYIRELARLLPNATFTHIDFDQKMNALAYEKYKESGISERVTFVHEDIQSISIPENTYDLIICVNALFVLQPQQVILKRIRSWLKPTGKFFIIDFGRKQRVLDWGWYLFNESVKRSGIKKAIKNLIDTREGAKQNLRASKAQNEGGFWLHTTEEFGKLLNTAGFLVKKLSICYRGYCDMAICEVPDKT